MLQASGRKESKCPSPEPAYVFPKGWPGNFPLQEILPFPCHPTPAVPHCLSQVTTTACLQHMTAVTFPACFTPQSCRPATKHMKTGAKRTRCIESGYLNSRLWRGDAFMPEISLARWGNLISLRRFTFGLSFSFSSHDTSSNPFAGVSLSPWRLWSISCGEQFTVTLLTILISYTT